MYNMFYCTILALEGNNYIMLKEFLVLYVRLLTEGINCAGVKWVIRLQLILLLMLFIAVLDFTVGSFVHTDPGQFCSFCVCMCLKSAVECSALCCHNSSFCTVLGP